MSLQNIKKVNVIFKSENIKDTDQAKQYYYCRFIYDPTVSKYYGINY